MRRLGAHQVFPSHLIIAILRQEDCKTCDALKRLNLDFSSTIQQLEKIDNPDNFAATNILHSTTEALFLLSQLEARRLKSDKLDTYHLCLAALRQQESAIPKIFAGQGIDYETLKNSLLNPHETNMGLAPIDDDDDLIDNNDSNSRPTGKTPAISAKQNKNNNSDTPALDNFSRDLSAAAERGELDPVVGREAEIQRTIQILCRRKKNNPVLIGEPGVGKSAIVEGLATRIAKRNVSRALFGKRIVSLDLAGMLAGTKYRGQFEERLKSVMNELENHPEVILFIDEIHTIVGAGATSGSLDTANMLKPALSRGLFQCIGATTLDEYRQSIEKDGALERRFQKIIVDPTSKDDTLQILHNIKDRYEAHHKVRYSDDALSACIRLSARYITDRSFPDKAIDVLDEAGARTHLDNMKVPSQIELLEKSIDQLNDLKRESVSRQDFELAAKYRDLAVNKEAELERMKNEWLNSPENDAITVDVDDIKATVANITGVPLQRMADNENQRLLDMAAQLQGQIIGQDRAVDKVVRAIRRSRVGLKNPNRPIGSFMFIGPTGVGKTLLAKKLAEYMFGSADAIIRIDMSEFMEKFSVSRLVGAPPGYVGYEQGGQLTERVRRKPYSIVLFDEIEKANSEVYNILLQLLDEGFMTDGLGRRVDFKNTVIIMTSNVGTRQLKEFGRGIGFNTVTTDDSYAQSVTEKALNRTFAPEFLNRIDDIVYFNQLTPDDILKIIDIELSQLVDRCANLNIELTIDDEAKNFLAGKGYNNQYGARPLQRTIQQYLEDLIVEAMLDKTLTTGKVSVGLNNDKTALQIIKK